MPSEVGAIDQAQVRRIAPLMQERIKTLGESAERAAYFFQEEIEYDPGLLVQKGMDQASTLRSLRYAREVLSPLKDFGHESLEEALRAAGKELGLSGRQFFGTLRVATTGRGAAPPLFETMEVLGERICLERIEAAARKLEAGI